MTNCDSHCDCQENIDDDEATEAVTVTEKSIRDGLLITTIAATTVRIFVSLRAMGVVQNDALITSMSLALLMSLPVQKG